MINIRWRNQLCLITGIGISNLGNWIYLIALNISILQLTGSPAAVAGLFIIRPIAVLITNIWAGSIIDRVNKRKLMIGIDIIRGILVFVIPFIGSIWIVYLLLLIINMVGSFFGPSSSIVITKLVSTENRTRFNSVMSMTNSGAFLLGPAVAGFLIMTVETQICIIINSISFFICALFIYFLPDTDEAVDSIREPLHWKIFLGDFIAVKNAVKKLKFFITVYLLFQGAMLIGFALDSQEVTYIKQSLALSDKDYGLIVSFTGAGSLLGAFVASLLSKKFKLRLYLGVGTLLTSIGYVLFYLSFNFLTATAAFVFLGFFVAFANTGYATFFQNSIPIDIMGRFGSITDMAQGIIQIGFTLILGFFAEFFSLQNICIVFSIVGAIFALFLFIISVQSSKANYFEEGSNTFNT
ncbi:MFS transporter [Peribacillus sp. B-H-3]|uniref:MFS transporter n=1 Tax=Peribacillus sp. B-H-3 TaxID=3400420 RepID=UPI003B011C88